MKHQISWFSQLASVRGVLATHSLPHLEPLHVHLALRQLPLLLLTLQTTPAFS